LTSFTAQINKGLTDETQIEEANSEQKEKGKAGITLTPKFEGDFGVKKFINLHGEVTGEIKTNPFKRISTENFRSIIIKKRNDEIFNDFEKYIIQKRLRKNKDTIQVGKYLYSSYKLNFINFTRIESLFDERLRESYIFHSEKNLNTIENFRSDKNNFTLEKFHSVRNNLSFLRTIIPYDTFLCGDNIFIPVKDEFLRGDKEQIGFSFEETATVVGRVKKLIDLDGNNQPRIIKTLNEINNISFNLLTELGFMTIPDTKKLYIIYPIAIFF